MVLTTGLCDPDPALLGCGANKLLVQALVDLTGYDRAHPATLIVKCDKSACAGGGISSYHLRVSLAPQGSLGGDVPACTVKGVVDPAPALSYCVDYR